MQIALNTPLFKVTSLLITAFVIVLSLGMHTSALSGSEFNAGRIIDDAVFYNSGTMSTNQIQQFLNSKVPICDTNGTEPYAGTTRASYGASRGYPAPYTCLKDYTQTVPEMINSGSDLCGGSIAGGTKSAAQIINDVSVACGINPQVLIVLLQKEQSLVTDDWPWSIQYRSATGYGCPDTAPCDAEFYGFFNQVYQAAKAFKRYEANPTSYNYRAQRNNFVYYNPNLAGCGGTNVFIENQATANLYIYTPYQPNAAALDNLYGMGDGCSAYGNRNFWRMFNDWFGSTQINFNNFAQPRWMQLNRNTYKLDAVNLSQIDGELLNGRQIKFASKVFINNDWCYRTQHDTDNFTPRCIPASHISELNIVYEPLAESEKVKAIIQDTNKVNLRTGKLDMLLAKDWQLNFDSKFTLGGRTFYVTERDKFNNIENGVLFEELRDSVEYQSMNLAWFKLNIATQKLFPATLQNVDGTLASGLELQFSSRVNVGGIWYYRTSNDTSRLLDKAIPLTDLDEITYQPFISPRWLQLKIDTNKVNPITGAKVDSKLLKNLQIKFSEKISINGKTYYRTEHDTTNGFDKAIPADAVIEVPAQSFVNPRWMVINEDTNKVVARTGEVTSQSITSGTQYRFTSKMNVAGINYYQIESDTVNASDWWVDSSKVSEVVYEPMTAPRHLKTMVSLRKTVPNIETEIDGTLEAEMSIYFKDKIVINGVTYLRTAYDSDRGHNKAIELDKLY